MSPCFLHIFFSKHKQGQKERPVISRRGLEPYKGQMMAVCGRKKPVLPLHPKNNKVKERRDGFEGRHGGRQKAVCAPHRKDKMTGCKLLSAFPLVGFGVDANFAGLFALVYLGKMIILKTLF